jgi:hypothetical protein
LIERVGFADQMRLSPSLVCALVFVLACSSLAYGQAEKLPVVDSQLRQRLVDNVIRELQFRYVAPERIKDITSYLRTKLEGGAYEKIKDANELALALTTDLRTASKDLHLLVGYNPALERALRNTFLIEDRSVPPENQARLRFIKTPSGKITELHLLVADGRSFPRAKDN